MLAPLLQADPRGQRRALDPRPYLAAALWRAERDFPAWDQTQTGGLKPDTVRKRLHDWGDDGTAERVLRSIAAQRWPLARVYALHKALARYLPADTRSALDGLLPADESGAAADRSDRTADEPDKSRTGRDEPQAAPDKRTRPADKSDESADETDEKNEAEPGRHAPQSAQLPRTPCVRKAGRKKAASHAETDGDGPHEGDRAAAKDGAEEQAEAGDGDLPTVHSNGPQVVVNVPNRRPLQDVVRARIGPHGVTVEARGRGLWRSMPIRHLKWLAAGAALVVGALMLKLVHDWAWPVLLAIKHGLNDWTGPELASCAVAFALGVPATLLAQQGLRLLRMRRTEPELAAEPDAADDAPA